MISNHNKLKPIDQLLSCLLAANRCEDLKDAVNKKWMD